jgi:hypothetical protein
MPTFYAFWFFFSAGWGYLLAGFSASDAPPLGQLVGSFPLAFVTFLVLLGLELRRQPLGKYAPRPSFKLKPWNRPIGVALFCALTFVFASMWGVGFSVAMNLSGLHVAFHFLALGSGALCAIFACPYVFPSKFGA